MTLHQLLTPKSLYILCYLIYNGIRQYYLRGYVSSPLPTKRECLLALGGALLWLLIPALYFTGQLHFADYHLSPAWIIPSGLFFAAATYIFQEAHRELGRYFSPTIRITASQKLIESGIYGSIRHPMYTALLLFGIGQALLVPNLIAGPATLVLWLTIAILRIPEEERVMLWLFGERYETYCHHTRRFGLF